MKLGLGTAQFGMNYGATNETGKVKKKDVKEILRFAENSGIEILDTAPVYGTAEQDIGELIKLNNHFKVITKTKTVEIDQEITSENINTLRSGFYESLKSLEVDKAYGLLVHNSDYFGKKSATKLVDFLVEIKEKNLVEKIGASAYTKEQIEKVLKLFCPDILQVPLNVFDRRLSGDGTLDKLAKSGIEIHARSVFLQGVLLEDPDALDDKYSFLRRAVGRFQEIAKLQGLSPIEGCLAYIKSQNAVSTVVIGVSSINEIRDIVEVWERIKPMAMDIPSDIYHDTRIMDPRRWPQ